jgi:L-alanine-DL-glutamate epimerase-like enolase superfamily enzyme
VEIESVDFFYLAMPEITLEADGSQDALLVRVTAGDQVGWGECEASPLPSIAAFVTPRSHGVCQPVSASVLGQRLDGPDDIRRIAGLVERNSMDLLQAPHTFSGIEMALWDLLGRSREEPVWRLLGYRRSEPKIPYASILFGDTPEDTLRRGRAAVSRGFRALKFGWAGFGEGRVLDDLDHLRAAREALGAEGHLLVDAGQVWGEDVEAAAARLDALAETRVGWLEEPFAASAYRQYADLAARTPSVPLAGGEGAHNVHMARNLVDYGGVSFLQIDCGRIGGIAAAKDAADYAVLRGVTYVNHTFTSHLALSASLQPFAGLADHRICEYPAEPKRLAADITATHLTPDTNGEVRAPDAPGLGIDVAAGALEPYLRRLDIVLDGEPLFSSAALPALAAVPDPRAV